MYCFMFIGVELARSNFVNLTVSPAANVALGENVTYWCSVLEEGFTVNWLIDDELAKIVNSSYIFVDTAAGVESSSLLILTAILKFNHSTISCFTSSGSVNRTLLIQGKACFT